MFQLNFQVDDKLIYKCLSVSVCIINKSQTNDSKVLLEGPRMKFTFHLLEAAALIYMLVSVY